LRYYRANPRKAREFAKSAGFLAKTDKVDAAMLAEYGRRIPLPAAEPVDPERKDFRALLDRRDQLVAMRKQEMTRLHQIADEAILAEMRAAIIELKERIEHYGHKIRAHIQAHPALQKSAALLASAPGIGPIAAARPRRARRTSQRPAHAQ
jgi:transposase